LAAVVLTPASASLATGATYRFAAVGRMSDSTVVPINVTYLATGGTITPDGNYSAGQSPGSYRVVAKATAGTLADTAQVSVVSAQATTAISPGQSIQAAVDAYPAGTAFTIKAGVHRLQSVAPKSGDSFTGEPGAVLSGARVLTAFTRSGALWVASGQTQEGAQHGECVADYPRCTRPEDLFIDNVMLRHVGSVGEVGPGRWFFDYAADKIYFADDPTGRTVETGVTPFAFKSSANDVTIRNLTIEKYASPNSDGTINAIGGARWVVEDNVVRWNHGSGIRTGDYMIARRNKVLANGHYGFNGQGDNILIEGNEIAYNSTTGVNPFWGAGGSKWTRTYRLVVRNNFVHHNNAKGLWTDIDNRETLYEGNIVEDNAMSGIFHEISYAATIRNNQLSRNGFAIPQKLRGGAITVTSSPDVEIYGNKMTGNHAGITINQDDRGAGAYGRYEVRNLNIHDNTVTQKDAGRAAGLGGSDPNFDQFAPAANNRFDHNTYLLGPDARFQWGSTGMTWTQWHTVGQDLTGSAQVQ
jgi:parallel beta-helix repeat protein